MLKLKYIIFFIFIPTLAVFSQNTENLYSLNTNSILSLYNNKVHSEYDYIIGREYKIYHSYKQDNPYLQSHHGKGIIYSKGYIYNNKIIIYDMYKDIVAVKPSIKTSSNVTIQIQKTQIDSFSIKFKNQTYLFKNIKTVKKGPNQIASGFYEIPYTGKYQLLFKHISKKGESEGITTYKHQIDKFLKIKNAYFNINSRKKFIQLFTEDKKRIKKRYQQFKKHYNELTTDQLIELIKFTEKL